MAGRLDALDTVAVPRCPAERPAGRPPAVAMDGVTKRYRGGGGVEDVTLRIDPGEVVALLGPNGAGKTTTIRLLLDLIRPDAGTIRLFGLDPRSDGVTVRGRVGYLPGELGLYERLTAREVLGHFARLRHGPPPAVVAGLAERFELELDRPIRTLSKGNRQKVGLVQALMGDPELLVLDEPTAGLDPLVQHEVLLAIREAARHGGAVLLSSHVLSEVAQVADRVGILRRGVVLRVERVEDLRERSVHYVDARLGPGETLSLAGLSGVVERATGEGEVHLEVTGPLDAVIGALARHHVLDLSVREPSLEELFLGAFGVATSPVAGAGAGDGDGDAHRAGREAGARTERKRVAAP